MDDIRDIYLSIKLGLARAVSKIVPPHEVEDVVQETYVRLCQVGAPEKIKYPKSYLYKTARNLALDSVKRADNRIIILSFPKFFFCFLLFFDFNNG